MADIIATPATDLAKFFNRDGAELLQEGKFNDRALRMLTYRQAELKTAFAKELGRQNQVLDQSKLKESKKQEVSQSAGILPVFQALAIESLAEGGASMRC